MIFNISTLFPAMSCILYIVFTGFGLSQTRRDKGFHSFNLYMLMMTIWSFGSFMMHSNLNVYTPLGWNRIMMVGMLGVPITMFHALLDLTGHKRNKQFLALNVGYILYAFLLYFNFSGSIVEKVWFQGNDFYYTLAEGAILTYSLCYLYMILALVHLMRQLRKAENKALRRKLIFPIYGVVILLLSVLVNLYEPLGKYPIDLFGTTLNAIFIFYAIYHYKLLNYSAIVLQGILYLVLVIISSSMFFVALWILSLAEEVIPINSIFAVSVILGILATLIFQPIRKGTSSLIEKLYLGKSIGSLQDLRDFSVSLNSIVELKTLGKMTTRKIRETYKLEWCAMLVQDYTHGNFQIFGWNGMDTNLSESEPLVLEKDTNLAKILSASIDSHPLQKNYPSIQIKLSGSSLSLNPSLILPLKFKNRINGYILMGTSEVREYYNQFDLDILGILQGHCSVTLENAITFERLKNQQKRLQSLNTELMVSRNKLEAFFDGITTPISIQDINYNIVMVNYAATKYFNTSYDELVGKKCYRVFFNNDKPCIKCLAQDCLHTQLPLEVEMTRKEGRMIFDVHFYPIAVPAEEDKLFLEFFQDISQQKKLQAELVQSEKLAGIGTLASGIAHELNNPLGGILGTAEIMIDLIKPETDLFEYTSDIIKYSETAASVIKELTSYSRKERGEVSLVDILSVLENALSLVKRGVDFSGITVEKNLTDLPAIEVNPNSLQQVFMNIIVNAAQSMPTGGTLSLECEQNDYSVRISIRDTGIGIEEEHLEEVFDPFFTTKDPGKGTGLGLSITHQLLTDMGGRIRINSQYRQGTEIIISLPIESEDQGKIRFVNVHDAQGREDVFFIQRKILVGEMGYREESIRREIDEKAYHILAYKGLQPVGTVSCVTSKMTDRLPIADHFDIKHLIEGKSNAEIDRLAVLKEERGSIIPMGLMTLAYLYARVEQTETLFLDVFADDKKQVGMYNKLGFQNLGMYSDPSPVQVMMLEHRTEYEKKYQRMEHFVKPLMARIIRRLDFELEEKEKFLQAVEVLVSTPSEL